MKKNMKRAGWLALAWVGLTFGLSSCLSGGDNYNANDQLAADVASIDNFLASSGMDAVQDISGVRMVITKLGTGLPALLSDSVDVDYVGTLFTTGAQFDAGNAKEVVNNFITGWKVALTTLPSGSEATIYVPSPWAYGNAEQSKIPANSILVFDIKFNRVMITQTQITQFKKDTTDINTYLTNKAISATKDVTGLRYTITQAGTGPIPGWYDRVKLHYDVKLLSNDAATVASVDTEPSSQSYNRVIDNIHGIRIALQRMQVGSKATLYVPSGYAYGPQGASANGGIAVPPNNPVIIELQLVSLANP